MIWAIASFEFRQRARRISFVAYFFTFAAISCFLFLAAAGAFPGVKVGLGTGGKVFTNSPFALHQFILLMSAFSLQLTAAVMGQSVYQDIHTGAHPLFFTLPVTPRQYLIGRFLGAFFALAVLFSSFALGCWVGSLMPFVEPSLIGPNRASAYLWPMLIGVLPNQLSMGAVFFALALVTRSMRGVYTSSVVMLTGYLLATSINVEVENRWIAALLDPFGLFATDHLTQYWSLAEKNERAIGLAGTFLWNRVLWCGIGVAIVAWTARRFRFAHPATGGASAAVSEEVARPASAGALVPAAVPGPARGLLWSLAWLEWKETVKNIYFIVIALSGVLFLAVAAKDMGSMYGTNTHPVTYQVLELTGGMFSLFVLITIVLFSGDLIWRERDQGSDQIFDSLPTPTWLPLSAKLAALVGMLLVLSVLVTLCGVFIQAVHGYFHFEFPLYFAQVFGLDLWRYVLLAVLAVFVHVMVNHKVAGHSVMIFYFVAQLFARRFGLEHNLYRYAGAPRAIYSDMNRFGHFLEPELWFMTYWTAFAGLLAVVAYLFWVRGKEERFRFRLALARRRLFSSPVAGGLAAVCSAGWIGLGSWIYYNTNILNRYQTDNADRELRAEYERRHKTRAAAEPQPKLVGVDVTYMLSPEDRDLEIRGLYKLRNKTTSTISAVYVTRPIEARSTSIVVGGVSTPAARDDFVGFDRFDLSSPLLPGQELELSFVVHYQNPGFENGHFNDRVAVNGTFVDTNYFPVVGYNEEMELSEDDDRRKQGLAPKERMADLHDRAERRFNYVSHQGDWISLRSVIATSPDQVGIAPGALKRRWDEGGKRWFEYVSEAPFLPYWSMLSARWVVKKDAWRNVAIEVYYHAGHEYNVERMIRAVKDTLEYETREIGPYPHSVVRIVEFPRYERFAQGFPTLIPYSESIGFIASVDPEDEEDIDYPYYVTAHEIGHQWWANQVLGANVQGATLLSETLAQYTALMVVKRAYGPEKMRRFLKYELDRYLMGRSAEQKKEMPLLRVENQNYVHYQKGGLVMYALQERLGEARVNAVLRRFCERTKWQEPPYATSEELIAELKVGATPEERRMIEDWFESRVLYELRAEKAAASGTGPWTVTGSVVAKKLRADELGAETEEPIDEVVDLGVLGEKGKVLWMQKRRITGAATFTATVSEEPKRAGIDPLNVLIDRSPDDNTIAVESAD